MSKRFFTYAGTAVLLLARLAVAQDAVDPADSQADCTTQCNVYVQDDPNSIAGILGGSSYKDLQGDCTQVCTVDQNASINDNSSSSSADDNSSSASDDSSSSSADTGDDGGSDSGDSGGGDDGGGLF